MGVGLRYRNTLTFGLILILVCTLARVGGQVPADLDVAGVQSSLAERIDREPIFIDGNADLLAQKVTYNWAGTTGQKKHNDLQPVQSTL